ncbi:hypothetical protein OESDEN_25195 [Oesophagostomum dentatum]|uniref:Uncharacterized protein n=1 Tax=Oesophagostomum dentatum TaxID=61180 RepID=A0A0B1RRD3_OESDE|nr:hypothetical protein OESDEN_25195 [Oesophagostomum dentatum]
MLIFRRAIRSQLSRIGSKPRATRHRPTLIRVEEVRASSNC